MDTTIKSLQEIKGWGVDADPKNDPTYPIRNRKEDPHQGYSWDRPTQQPVNVEVLHSNERPNVAAVFGTSNPPMGLSGVFRRLAFKFSEGNWWHWLNLLVADRINIVEGILIDLAHGHIPNPIKERGWKMEWRYGRAWFLTKLAIGTVVFGGVVALVVWAIVD